MVKYKNKYDREGCLDETLINQYIFHQCPLEVKEKIEAHLETCDQCRGEVIFLMQEQEGIQDEKKWGNISNELYKKGIAVYDERLLSNEPSLEIFFNFIRNRWKAIKHNGILISQPILASRDMESQGLYTLINVKKELNDHTVEVASIGQQDGTIEINIKVYKSIDNELVPAIRFMLWDKTNQKTINDGIQDGEILLRDIKPGKYDIHLFYKEEHLGKIELTLKG